MMMLKLQYHQVLQYRQLCLRQSYDWWLVRTVRLQINKITEPALHVKYVSVAGSIFRDIVSALKPNRSFPENRTETAVFFKTKTEPMFKNLFCTFLRCTFVVVWFHICYVTLKDKVMIVLETKQKLRLLDSVGSANNGIPPMLLMMHTVGMYYSWV